jgi:hypothetical protein
MTAVLTESQIASFMADGYVVLPEAVPAALAARYEEFFWSRLRATGAPLPWPKPMLHLQEAFAGAPFAEAYNPTVTGAIDDLVGSGRWRPIDWMGWWLATLPGHDTPPWRAPEVGWHVDGLYDVAGDLDPVGLPEGMRIRGRQRRPPDYRYRLNGREHGVVLLFMITDMPPGSGTAVVPGSHRVTAEHIRNGPAEGLMPADLQALLTEDLPETGLDTPLAYENQIIKAQRKRPISGGHRGVLPPGMRTRVREVTGKRGDVVLFHPFTLHATSANTAGAPRIISNPWVELLEDARLDVPVAEATPLELVLRA